MNAVDMGEEVLIIRGKTWVRIRKKPKQLAGIGELLGTMSGRWSSKTANFSADPKEWPGVLDREVPTRYP